MSFYYYYIVVNPRFAKKKCKYAMMIIKKVKHKTNCRNKHNLLCHKPEGNQVSDDATFLIILFCVCTYVHVCVCAREKKQPLIYHV